jgi:hypothetical protein
MKGRGSGSVPAPPVPRGVLPHGVHASPTAGAANSKLGHPVTAVGGGDVDLKRVAPRGSGRPVDAGSAGALMFALEMGPIKPKTLFGRPLPARALYDTAEAIKDKYLNNLTQRNG